MIRLPNLTDADIGVGNVPQFVLQERRQAARVVVVDQVGHVALMFTGVLGYHKLPGGGMEPGEDSATAAIREVREEAGCDIDHIVPIGVLQERRGHNGLWQINYGFLGRVVGDKGKPQFTPKEVEEAFEVRWLPSIDAAIAALDAEQHTRPDPAFMRLRELRFLRAAKQHLAGQ